MNDRSTLEPVSHVRRPWANHSMNRACTADHRRSMKISVEGEHRRKARSRHFFMLASGFVRTLISMALSRRPASARTDNGEGTGTLRHEDTSVEANARLTSSTAAVLFVLLAAEGFTILRVRALLSPHVFIGMLLVPLVVLKIGSTSYRFVRYYFGSPAYRRKGPPPLVLRMLGPFVVVLTLVVFGSGIALLLVRPPLRPSLLLLHKASFVLWFGAMAIHVLGHLVDTARLAPRDWMRRTRRDVAGAGLRQWAVVSSVVVGSLLGLLLLGQVRPWLASSTTHSGLRLHSPSPASSATTTGSQPLSTTSSTAPSFSTTTPLRDTPPVALPTVPAGNASKSRLANALPHSAKSHAHHRVRKKPKH